MEQSSDEAQIAAYHVGSHMIIKLVCTGWMVCNRLTCICDDPCSLRSLGDDFGNWLRRIGCRQQKQAWHEEEQRMGGVSACGGGTDAEGYALECWCWGE
jgi:hypothetical protein